MRFSTTFDLCIQVISICLHFGFIFVYMHDKNESTSWLVTFDHIMCLGLHAQDNTLIELYMFLFLCCFHLQSFGVHWCPFGSLTRLPSSFE